MVDPLRPLICLIFFDSYPHIQKPYFHGFRTSNGIIAFPTLSFPRHVQDIRL